MKIRGDSKNGILRLRLLGELDHHAAASAMKEIDDIMDRYIPVDCALDLSGLSFMDSSGVGMLIGYYKEMSALGGRVAVSGVRPRIEKLFYVSGLHKIIKTYSKVEDVFHE